MARTVSKRGRLGTFAGVFTPSILTILGIVLFLRLGHVVGGAGLPQALGIILAANAISTLTTVSVAAVATNLEDQGRRRLLPDLAHPRSGLRRRHRAGAVPGPGGLGRLLLHRLRRGGGGARRRPTARGRPRLAAAAILALLGLLAWLGADWATRVAVPGHGAAGGGAGRLRRRGAAAGERSGT